MDALPTPNETTVPNPLHELLGVSATEGTLLRNILDRLPGIFYVLGPDGRLMYWNDRFETRTGYAPAELRGRRAYEFFEGEDRKRAAEALLEVFAQGETRLEAPLVPARGEPIPMLLTGNRIRSGKTPYLVGMGIDITERKRAEEEVRKREAWIRSINQNVSEAIYRSTPDDGLVYANPAFARMFGYESPEAVKQVDSRILYADPETRRALARQLETEGTIDGAEVRYRRTDGSTFVGLLNSSVVRDDKGTVRYYDGVITDITDRKRREKTLREARRQAEAATRSKSRFLQGVAHDLRSPLSMIEMSTDLLDDAVGDVAQSHLARIRAAADQLRGMADTLTDLAHLQTGGVQLEREHMDVRPVVTRAADSLRGRAEEQDVELRVMVPDVSVEACVNANALRRVVDNLVGNSIKYCGTGDRVEVRLRASATARDGGEEGACLEVRDTGPGMSAEVQKHVFEPYWRGDDPEASGSGLGLAIARELVEAMEGNIRVQSEPGKGTSFRIFLSANRSS